MTFTKESGPFPSQHGAFYAAQTFSDVPDGRRIQIGWVRTAAYAQQFPGQIVNQAMSLPHEMTLHQTDDGWGIVSIGDFRSINRSQHQPLKSVLNRIRKQHKSGGDGPEKPTAAATIDSAKSIAFRFMTAIKENNQAEAFRFVSSARRKKEVAHFQREVDKLRERYGNNLDALTHFEEWIFEDQWAATRIEASRNDPDHVLGIVLYRSEHGWSVFEVDDY